MIAILRIAIVAIVASLALEAAAVKRPEIHNGVLDLSSINFPGKESVLLEGKWYFYWHEFIPVDGSSPHTQPIELRVRGTWRGATYAGAPLPAQGWGSYALQIKLNSNRADLALKMPNVGTAYALFANGLPIATAGNPAETAATAASQTLPQVVPLPAPDVNGHIALVLHISNFDDRHGGIWQSIALGSRTLLENQLRENHALAMFLFGAILMIAIHHILIFARNPKEKSNLAFGLLCILLALRAVVEGDRYLMSVFPNFPWLLNSRIAYLTFYGSLLPAAWLMRSIFSDQFNRRVLQLTTLITVPMCFIVIILPPRLYTETLSVMQGFALLIIVYGAIIIVRAIAANSRGAKTLAVGFAALFIASILDILTVAEIVNLPQLSGLGLIAFIIAQSLLISLRQEDAHTRLKILSAENRQLIDSMEAKILDRTATITELSAEADAVLDALSEGVFLIDRDHSIGNKFSRRALEILNLNAVDLAGQNFVQVMQLAIGRELADEARIYVDVLFNTDMDDQIVYTLNPLEKVNIAGVQDKPKKNLRFQFSRRYRRGEITGILVTCRDVTHEESIKTALAERQLSANRQFEIVETLLAMTPAARAAFYPSIATELASIEAALGPQGSRDLRERIKTAYRAVHTIKGNAQLYAAEFLANQAHEFEDKLQVLMTKENLENLDLMTVNAGYLDLLHALDEFDKTIQKIIEFQIDQGSNKAHLELDLKEYLVKFTEQLCKTTGKNAIIRFNNLALENLPQQYVSTLRDTLVQLVRNALAHGIELEPDRNQFEKPKTGEILISMVNTNNEVLTTVRDDGRGFDLAAIRDNAISRAVARQSVVEQMSDHALIELIFLPGFSTATTGGSLAGRGIGLDLVRKKIQDLGGRVEFAWKMNTFTEFTIALPKKY